MAESSPRVLVVVAHPHDASLTRGLAMAAVVAASDAGARVWVHDLYADGFDPMLKTYEIGTGYFDDPLAERYVAELIETDGIVVVHPVWFFHAPAVLKGWVERIVREGVAFGVSPEGAITGLLRARRALVVTTANSSTEVERSVFGDPLVTFWRKIVFGPAGVPEVERVAFTPVRGSDEDVRTAWLAEVRTKVARLVADLEAGAA
ncbi:MAG: NAD(P)H-dependent oxidoreductase [Trueperaceae bacterium]|nr:NAD(P)H-dependent oxidoreductase [Trueperaceae bacterium]